MAGTYQLTNLPYSGAGPSCSINQRDCFSLQSSSEANTVLGRVPLAPGNQPDLTSIIYASVSGIMYAPAYTVTSSAAEASYCGVCTLMGDSLQLWYFTVTANHTRDLCVTTLGAPTICPFCRTGSRGVSEREAQSITPCSYIPYTFASTTNSGSHVVINGRNLYQNLA